MMSAPGRPAAGVRSARRAWRKPLRRAAGTAAVACLAAGCGGGGGGSSAPPNVQPTVAAISDQTVAVGESKSVTVFVSDGNSGDRHTLRVTSSAPAIVTVSVLGTTVTLTAVAAGTATVTVTATDSSGSANATSPAVTFTVTVERRGWTSGVFEDAAVFKDLCRVPRRGVDAQGNAYLDMQGATVDENNWLRSWSNDTYLWYDEITDRDPACCDTPDYFDLLRTFERTASGQPKDRFHFTEETAARLARVRSGVTAGYGARFAVLASRPPRDVRVAYTEPDSPATAASVALRRGTRILAVDGVDVGRGGAAAINAGLFPRAVGEEHEFTVRDPGADADREVTMTSATITTAPVQHVRVLETDTGEVGYLLFNTHIGPAEKALKEGMERLARAGVGDMVLDLRYNGGGYLAIASQMAYMIAGSPAVGRVFNEAQFNDKHPTYNPVTGDRLTPSYFRATTTGWFDEPGGLALPALGLERLFVLSGPNTCSASEAIINGLRGIDVEVVLVGATTCGKPYGFYPQDNCGTTYNTVQFRGVNAKGFGDYADGFTPANAPAAASTKISGCVVADDFDHAFGDPAEARLAAALRYRMDGSCPPIPAVARAPRLAEDADDSVIDRRAGAFGEAIAGAPGWVP